MRVRIQLAIAILAGAVCFSAAQLSAQSRADAAPAAPSTQNAPANAAPAHGESAEDETAQFKHSGSVQLLSKITGLSAEGAYWLAVALNFAIVAGLIVWASKKNLPAVFRNRSASIQKSIEEARRASEDAQRRLSEVESRLGRLDEEIGKIRATSQAEADAEEARSKAATDEELRRIVESAELEISSAAKAARRDLTAYAADLAVALAAKQIRVDETTDQALVRNFSQHLSGDGRKQA